MAIPKIKHIYDGPAADDGYRVPVGHLLPRGLSKGHAKLDLWLKDTEPSNRLRKWFGHDPAKYDGLGAATKWNSLAMPPLRSYRGLYGNTRWWRCPSRHTTVGITRRQYFGGIPRTKNVGIPPVPSPHRCYTVHADRGVMFDFKRNHVLQAVLFALLIWVVVTLKDVILLVFIAFLLTVVLHPLVRWLRRHYVPKALAVLTPVIGVVVLAGLAGYVVVPVFIVQSRQFISSLPHFLESLKHFPPLHHVNIGFDSLRSALGGEFGTFGNFALAVTNDVVALVVGALTVIVMTLYWTASYDTTKATLQSYVPQAHRSRVMDIWSRIEKKLGSWVLAQVLLSAAVGVLVWIGSLVLGLPFPGALGIISGLFEIVPTLGPIAAAIPGILLGLTVSFKTGALALIMYLVVQQIENHILAPLLLGRTVKLHPVVIIISLLVGAILVGILGALLAVPAALCISAIVDSYREGSRRPLSKRSRHEQ